MFRVAPLSLVKYGGIVTLQTTDMAHSQRIQITEVLCNYYNSLQVPRQYWEMLKTQIKVYESETYI